MHLDSGTILFRNTMRITEGHLEAFKRAIDEAVRFVEENGPQLMVEVFIDEERMLAYSFQLYRDSESILAHWRMSDPYIQGVMEHCTVQQFEVYGEPNETVMQGLRAASDQFPVTFAPRLAGFSRLAANSAA